MTTRKLMRIPKITTVAMLALIAAGCNNNDASNDMSTDVNLTGDAAANDVLGANAMTDNEAAVALPCLRWSRRGRAAYRSARALPAQPRGA